MPQPIGFNPSLTLAGLHDDGLGAGSARSDFVRDAIASARSINLAKPVPSSHDGLMPDDVVGVRNLEPSRHERALRSKLMSWTTRTKMALASIIFRHRVLNRWAHKQLPKKRMAATVMLFDEAGRLLLVKPSYRHDWLIPGGIVENNEPPWLAARRETAEEVSLCIDQLRLVAVDWRSTDDHYDDSLHFLFEGGHPVQRSAGVDPMRRHRNRRLSIRDEG